MIAAFFSAAISLPCYDSGGMDFDGREPEMPCGHPGGRLEIRLIFRPRTRQAGEAAHFLRWTFSLAPLDRAQTPIRRLASRGLHAIPVSRLRARFRSARARSWERTDRDRPAGLRLAASPCKKP